ncbi:hypothetical protein GS424_008890 [Eggerthella guodeyinii]|uniref:Uncharacterized protein n=1 Tax=Eggerthella guodeyinii TaxID=2690837 RepID=A0A6L7IQG9_9ACTN|nr:hypothetical protein [Eggerthella guodeyinii]QOS66688.1 hypothetical protein GS424_008890 [Eggerthella guodeyinii]
MLYMRLQEAYEAESTEMADNVFVVRSSLDESVRMIGDAEEALSSLKGPSRKLACEAEGGRAMKDASVARSPGTASAARRRRRGPCARSSGSRSAGTDRARRALKAARSSAIAALSARDNLRFSVTRWF